MLWGHRIPFPLGSVPDTDLTYSYLTIVFIIQINHFIFRYEIPEPDGFYFVWYNCNCIMNNINKKKKNEPTHFPLTTIIIIITMIFCF